MKYELRRAPRVTVPHLVVRYAGETRDVYGNLSTGGVGFFSGEPVPAAADLEVFITDPDSGALVSLYARVTHVVSIDDRPNACYAGAIFGSIDPLTEGALERWVEESIALHRLKKPSRAA